MDGNDSADPVSDYNQADTSQEGDDPVHSPPIEGIVWETPALSATHIPAPGPRRVFQPGCLRSRSPPAPYPLLHRSQSPPLSMGLRSISPLVTLSNGAMMAVPGEPASQSSSSPLPSLSATNIFGALPKLEYHAKTSCNCCSVPGDSLITSFPEVPLTIAGNRKLMLPVDTDEEFSQELWTALGSTMWETLLGDISPSEIRPISGVAGLNHVFIARVRTWFVKAVNFESAATSEAQQMEYLKNTYPTLVGDPTLVFPTRWCRVITSECSYDVLAYTYVDGKNVRDLVWAYEQSPKERKVCLRPNIITLIRCCAELLRRYHLVHGRKHGDAKADNFMVTLQGQILLCDHGVNSLALCDKKEFMRSLVCLDPEVAKFKTMFGTFFDETRDIREVSDDDRTQMREVLRYVTQLHVPIDSATY